MNYEPQFAGEALADATREKPRPLRQIGVVLVVLVLAGLLLWGLLSRLLAPSAPPAQREIPNVTVLSARPVELPMSVSGTGSIAARRDMPVSVVGEGGRVTRVLVEPGDRVRAGQVLAVIERSVQSEQVASLAAQVDVARADAKLAEANLQRARGLIGNGFISRADLDSRVATRDSAVARLNVAIAQLAQARATMARLDVRAPEAGLVLTRSVEAGQVVSGGSGVLFRIAKDGEMEMRLALSESDLAGVRPGNVAQVTPVGSTRAVTGRVWQVAPVVDPQTRQGAVRILLPYDPSLRPGAFAQARVATVSLNGFRLPESAVQNDDRGSYVYVVGAGNRVQRRPVQTGPISDAGVAVMGGLRPGDKVVSMAGGFLNPGDPVKPVPAGSR